MKQETVEKGKTTRGSVEYIEIERRNKTFENILNRLGNNKYSDISVDNQAVILEFLTDMSKGRYTPIKARKGQRSYKRLCKLFYTLKTFVGFYSGKNIQKITEDELHNIFDALNSDKLRRKDGAPYKDKRDFKKDFSTFWHWHMVKTYKTRKERVPDITEFITTSKESRPTFCHFTFNELQKDILTLTSKEDLRVVLTVLFDSGLRPSEFYNIRMKDIKQRDEKLQVLVREEVSKTFERTITLALSSQLFSKYLDNQKLQRDDLLFIGYKYAIDKFFSRIKSDKSIKKLMLRSDTNKLTAYDFRHSSACHYLNVYSQDTAACMKYRYGWKKESMIEYYTNFLGVTDTITEEDLLDVKDKNKYLEENKELKSRADAMEEKLSLLSKQMERMMLGQNIPIDESKEILDSYHEGVK